MNSHLAKGAADAPQPTHKWWLGRSVLPLAVIAVSLAAVAPALAATVSGSVTNGLAYHVLLVQANGVTKKARLKTASGAFSISCRHLDGASLQLVNADGTYFGPVVLKRTATKALIFIKGTTSLKLGSIALKGGWALVVHRPLGRYKTTAAYTASAVGGVPIGAGKLGRVRTSTCLGLRGPGGDLDRDGIINAIDIDDNGNKVLDNIDRSHRGASRPLAAPLLQNPGLGSIARENGVQLPDNEISIWSNLPLFNATTVNGDISAVTDIWSLINQYQPMALMLSVQEIGGNGALLDGLGDPYLQAHAFNGTTYPQVQLPPSGGMQWVFGPPTYTGTSLNLSAGLPDTACAIYPGAVPADQLASGDCFVETVPSGTSYAGTLNFVFLTTPAFCSYQFDTDASPTVISYDANGVAPVGMTSSSPIVVPSGASKVTLTFWRPQREAVPGEVGNAEGLIDIGGLTYSSQVSVAQPPSGPPDTGTHDPTGAYSNAIANGVPITTGPTTTGLLDPASDAPASSTSTITFTLDLSKCYSHWASFVSGMTFTSGVGVETKYGDNTGRTLYFVLQ